MSEAIHCDYCKKSVLLSEVTDWWRIEPVHAQHRIGDDDGGDFCSDRCALNFFANRLKDLAGIESADSWEYTTLYMYDDSPTKELNELGTKGWELVAVVTRDGGADIYLLKRLIDAKREG